jgi:bifunctional NMN adenylyltransferase/nudix hydrolase
LADDITLPKVKGADDAEKAKWVPISELREEDFFDDHYFIIQYFLGL